MTCSDDELPSQFLTEVRSLLEVCSALFLRLCNVSVDSGEFGGDVTWCWCKEYELLNSFPIFTLGLKLYFRNWTNIATFASFMRW